MNHIVRSGECMFFMPGDIHDTRDARCAWGMKDCEGCPIPQMDIPQAYEIRQVTCMSAACIGCPEMGRECDACREDEKMRDFLKPRAYTITIEERYSDGGEGWKRKR